MMELTWKERGRLWLRLGLRLALLLLALLCFARFGATLWDWFSPFLLAGVFAWVLSPLVRLCQKKLKLPRRLSSLAVLLLVVALLGGVVWSLGSGLGREVVSLAANWEETLAALEGVADSLGSQLSRWLELMPAGAREMVDGMMARLFTWLEGTIPQMLSWAMDQARGVALALPSFTVAAIAFVMASYFILADLPRFRVMVADKLPEGPRVFLAIVKRAVSAGFGGYVRAELLLSVGVFFILLLGFLLIRQPYALLLALALAVLDFIPIIGSGTAMVPWAAVDVLTGDYRHALGLMAVWGLVALFRRVGEPKILGGPDRPVPPDLPGQRLRGHEGGQGVGHDPGPGGLPGGPECAPLGGAGRRPGGCPSGLAGHGRHPEKRPAGPEAGGKSLKIHKKQAYIQNMPEESSCFGHIFKVSYTRSGKPYEQKERINMYYNDYNNLQKEPWELQPLPQPEPPKKKKGRGVKIAALCLVCALLGGVAGGLAVRSLPALSGNTTTLFEGTHAPVAVGVSNVTTEQPMTGAQVYAKNVGSSVGITTELVTTNYWGQKVRGAAAGSGFVISSDGYILTNYHVIKGATSIQVAFVDGKTYPATLIGGEEANDVAVLKIEAQGLTPVVLGDSDNLVVGEQVCAIGNPLGELTFTFTAGYVSARDRSITMENGEVMNMLQTDTAINSGNSGGPLFNMYGEVIGITTAKYSSGSSSNASIEGIGFAIPINDVKDMVKDLMEKGYITGKPSLGILMNNVSAEATYRYGIPQGAYIEAVLEGSCAQKAGLQVGDIVTAVEDHEIASSTALQSVVKEYQAGDEVSFTVYREREYVTVTLTLDERTLQRTTEMEKLKESFQETQQQEEQQQQQGTSGWSWPFGFNW